MGRYEKSAELAQIAEKVITENAVFTPLMGGCRIAYQTCENSKTGNGKVIYADTERVKDKLKALLPYDFIVTFYADGTALSDEIKERLMYHELRHIGFDAESERYYIVPHDLEDFKDVIEKWGVDWIAESE